MRPAWGQERHQMPYLKVPRAGGAGRVLSSTPRSGWPGFLSVTGCVRARLERKESEPAGVRRVDAPAAARRRPWGAGLLHPHPTEPWRFQVKISQATAPVSRASRAGTGLLQAPTTRAVGPGAQSGWRWVGVTGPLERRVEVGSGDRPPRAPRRRPALLPPWPLRRGPRRRSRAGAGAALAPPPRAGLAFPTRRPKLRVAAAEPGAERAGRGRPAAAAAACEP